MNNRPPAYYTSSIDCDTDYPILQSEVDVDIAIVGGGFTGVNTALNLAEKGYCVAVIEAEKIGFGATGRNGGQVTGSLSGGDAMRKAMRKTLGKEVDDFIWHLRFRGHDIIQSRVEKYGIDCDLKVGHLHAAMKKSHLPELYQSLEEAERRGMGDQVSLISSEQMPEFLASPLYIAALYNQRNMHLHPLKLCLGEAQAAAKLGVQFFEHSPVTHIERGAQPVVVTAQGRVKANQVLLAGNAYHKLERKKLGGLLFPAAGGIVTTEPLGDLADKINPKDLAVYDCRFVLDYYRLTKDKRLLFGGGAHYNGKPSRHIEQELRPGIEQTFPDLKGVKIDYAWSGQMGITINRIPQLGRLSNNIFYAQGYSGHGIALSHIVSEIMANALDGELKQFDTFAACKSIKVPGTDWLGQQFLTLGMWYYLLLEKLR